MCCIAAQAIGKKLPVDALENMWSHNDDGAGYCFVNEFGQLTVRKPFFKLKKLLRSYNADYALHGANSPFIVHVRWSTHGNNNKLNTHPHTICGSEVALSHNGVLSDFLPPHGRDISDTVFFCRTVFEYRATEHVMDATFRKILGKMIGKSNKFAMMDKNKNLSIVNEDQGVWDDESGVWFSNADYAAPYTRYSYTPAAQIQNHCFPGAVPATAVKTVDGAMKFIGRHGDIVTYDGRKRSLPAAYQQDEIPWDGYVDVQTMNQSEFEQMLNTMSGEEIIDNIEFDELTEDQWKQVSAKLEIEAMDKKFEESLL